MPSIQVRIPTGVRVRDPVSRQVLTEGTHTVTESSFWHRRVRDGSVSIVQPDSPAPSARRAKGSEGEK